MVQTAETLTARRAAARTVQRIPLSQVEKKTFPTVASRVKSEMASGEPVSMDLMVSH